MMFKKVNSLLFFILVIAVGQAQEKPVLDIMLTNYEYPFDVHFLEFKSQEQELRMAYMDIQAENPNGQTIMLLHGKNFNGAYWKTTVEALAEEGFRVIVPDQIGFGKSTKPVGYQFTFQQLAQNTKAVLEVLNIDKVHVLGHSMGGMLAARFTLMYPESVEKLILENPIGLEDWKLVAPYVSIDEYYKAELAVNYEKAKQYQLEFYYDHKWKPEYNEWVYLLTGWTKHPDYPIVAMNNAQTYDMIFTQPVLYEFKYIQAPTLLIIGTRDRTALGKNTVKDKAVRDKMGLYQNLGKEAQKSFPHAELIELEDVGHMPHIEVFDRFIQPLKSFLKN